MTTAENIALVAQVKAELQAAGQDLTGVGAFRIVNRVARQLGFLLLRKGGGNRAVPQADGRVLSGDQDRSPNGYATDYIIDPVTFYGYDILGDGGGSNNPQWGGPETAADMVARNRVNFASPLANWPPAPVVVVPEPVEPVVVPEPEPSILGLFVEKLDALTAEVRSLRAELADMRAKGAVAQNRYIGTITLTFPK